MSCRLEVRRVGQGEGLHRICSCSALLGQASAPVPGSSTGD